MNGHHEYDEFFYSDGTTSLAQTMRYNWQPWTGTLYSPCPDCGRLAQWAGEVE